MIQHHLQSQNSSFQTMIKMKQRACPSVQRSQLSWKQLCTPGWEQGWELQDHHLPGAKSTARGEWDGWSWQLQRRDLVQLVQRGHA